MSLSPMHLQLILSIRPLATSWIRAFEGPLSRTVFPYMSMPVWAPTKDEMSTARVRAAEALGFLAVGVMS
jgi:hypothetical protein